MTHWSLLSVAGLLIGLAAFVSRANTGSPINRWFAWYMLTSAFWTLGIAGVYSSDFIEIWGRLAFAASTLIPVCLIGFIDHYPQRTGSIHRPLRWTLWGVGLGLSVLSATTPL